MSNQDFALAKQQAEQQAQLEAENARLRAEVKRRGEMLMKCNNHLARASDSYLVTADKAIGHAMRKWADGHHVQCRELMAEIEALPND